LKRHFANQNYLFKLGCFIHKYTEFHPLSTRLNFIELLTPWGHLKIKLVALAIKHLNYYPKFKSPSLISFSRVVHFYLMLHFNHPLNFCYLKFDVIKTRLKLLLILLH